MAKGKRRKRFNSENAAKSFAAKVDGKVNDLRDVEGAKSPFTVTYKVTAKTKEAYESKHPMQFPNCFWQ